MTVYQFYELFYSEIYGHDMENEELTIIDLAGNKYDIINVRMGDIEGIEIIIRRINHANL